MLAPCICALVLLALLSSSCFSINSYCLFCAVPPPLNRALPALMPVPTMPAMAAAVATISQHLHVDVFHQIEAQLREQWLRVVDGPVAMHHHLDVRVLEVGQCCLNELCTNALVPMRHIHCQRVAHGVWHACMLWMVAKDVHGKA